LIRNKIIDKKISFADAARTESDQKRRANGGVLINPNTQDTVLS
jgi:peptidyl-prolyl cis-trans isomerase SurA